MYSRHNSTDRPINLQRLWHHAQSLHTPKPGWVSTLRLESKHQPQSQIRSYLQLTAIYKKIISFLHRILIGYINNTCRCSSHRCTWLKQTSPVEFLQIFFVTYCVVGHLLSPSSFVCILWSPVFSCLSSIFVCICFSLHSFCSSSKFYVFIYLFNSSLFLPVCFLKKQKRKHRVEQ